jgi:hypothetical protein
LFVGRLFLCFGILFCALAAILVGEQVYMSIYVVKWRVAFVLVGAY